MPFGLAFTFLVPLLEPASPYMAQAIGKLGSTMSFLNPPSGEGFTFPYPASCSLAEQCCVTPAAGLQPAKQHLQSCPAATGGGPLWDGHPPAPGAPHQRGIPAALYRCSRTGLPFTAAMHECPCRLCWHHYADPNTAHAVVEQCSMAFFESLCVYH